MNSAISSPRISNPDHPRFAIQRHPFTHTISMVIGRFLRADGDHRYYQSRLCVTVGRRLFTIHSRLLRLFVVKGGVYWYWGEKEAHWSQRRIMLGRRHVKI